MRVWPGNQFRIHRPRSRFDRVFRGVPVALPPAGPSIPGIAYGAGASPGQVSLTIDAPPSAFGDGAVAGDGLGAITGYVTRIAGVLASHPPALPIVRVSGGHAEGVQVPMEGWALGFGGRAGLAGSALVYPAVAPPTAIYGLIDQVSGQGLIDAVSGAGLYTLTPPPATVQVRAASVATDHVIASGHSLTDAWYYGGTWPGFFKLIRESAYGASGGSRKSTVPGSSLEYRWANPVTDDGLTNADARVNIADFDLLVITEAGPPPRPGVPADAAQLAVTLDYLFRFTENAHLAGTETILQSINPWHAGAWGLGFRDSLVEYERAFHYLAETTSAAMRAEYPALPEDYRVWIMPCHRLWIRVWDDLQTGSVPGYTTLASLFDDDIHPNTDAEYGLACLAVAMIYQRNPSTIPGFFVPAGMSTALRNYLWDVAWEIVTTYRWAGLGGGDAGAVYTPPPVADPSETLGARLIAWFEPGQGGALQTAGGAAAAEGDPVGLLPDLAGGWDLAQATAGARPTLAGGAVGFDGANDVMASALGAAAPQYMIARMRLGLLAATSYDASIVALSPSGSAWWSGNAFRLTSNHTPGAGEELRLLASAQGMSSPLRTIAADTLATVEVWHTADALAISIDGAAAAVEAGAPDPVAIARLSTGCVIDAAGGTGGFHTPVDLYGLAISSALPSDAERAALRAWAAAIPHT